MFRFIQSLLHSARLAAKRRRSARRTARKVCLGLEHLEDRLVPAAARLGLGRSDKSQASACSEE